MIEYLLSIFALWFILRDLNIVFFQILYFFGFLVYVIVLIRTVKYFFLNRTVSLKLSDDKIVCNETYGRRVIYFEDVLSFSFNQNSELFLFSLREDSRKIANRSILDRILLHKKDHDSLKIRGYEDKENLKRLIYEYAKSYGMNFTQ